MRWIKSKSISEQIIAPLADSLTAYSTPAVSPTNEEAEAEAEADVEAEAEEMAAAEAETTAEAATVEELAAAAEMAAEAMASKVTGAEGGSPTEPLLRILGGR